MASIGFAAVATTFRKPKDGTISGLVGWVNQGTPGRPTLSSNGAVLRGRPPEMDGSPSPILVSSPPRGVAVLPEVLRGSSDVEAAKEPVFDAPSRREASSEALAQS